MRFRYIWFVIVAVVFLLGFFGIWTMPKDWRSAIDVISPIESWWAAHSAHPILTAFLIGLAFSTLCLPEAIRIYREHFTRPKLDIEFDPVNVDECRLDDGKPWTQFRMKVGNYRSGKIIHNCQGRIDRVESQLLTRPYVEKVPLTWALRTNEDSADLQDGHDLPLNVIILRTNQDGPSTAQFISRPDANNSPHPFNATGEYDCTVVVTSDETKPKYVTFTFDWTGDRATARIKNVKAMEQNPQTLKGKKSQRLGASIQTA